MLCHKSLVALIMHILVSFVNSKTIHKVLVLNKLTMRTRRVLPPLWRQRGWRQTIHRPTYSVARVIGACMARRFHLSQSSLNSHYLCCHVSFIVLVTWTSDHSATVMWSIACRKGWQECLICPCHFSVHVLMSCRIHVHGACARPDIHRLCMTCLLDRFRLDCLTHSFCFVHFCFISYGQRFYAQSHCDDSHVHALTPFVLHMHLLRLAPIVMHFSHVLHKHAPGQAPP